MSSAYRTEQVLGLLVGTVGSISTSLNASANWMAIGFVANGSRTLNGIRAYIATVTGTLGASDILCDLYDSAGTGAGPGASIETGKTPTATITATGWYDFTGFTTVLTVGQMYYAVFRNVNGSPASNFPAMRQIQSVGMVTNIGNQPRQMWAAATSTNSGSTWSVTASRTGIRLAYSDGTYDGIMYSNTQTALVADGVYNTRESGVVFTSPMNAILNVVGLAFYMSGKTGSPTGSPRFGLWTGTTPVNQIYSTLPSTALTTTQWLTGTFSSPIIIQPSTVCRVTVGETTQSDSSSNRYSNTELIWDTDSNSLALLPFEGTLKKTYFDGSNWTDTSGSVFGFALLLDASSEFSAPYRIIGG